MIGRRGFLKALGLGAAAAPAAAKSMADLTPQGLGLSNSAYAGFGSLAGASGVPCTSLNEDDAGRGKWLLSQLRELADPSILEERWRNTYASTLDADVAAMGSVSLSSKIRIQRRINYERELAARKADLWRELKLFRSRK